MSKKQLLDRVRAQKIPVLSNKEGIDSVLNELRKMITEQRTVRIKGLGTFELVERKASRRTLPDMRIVEVPQRLIVKFKMSKDFFREEKDEDTVR